MKSTLNNIGQNLTAKGDILFYGCNIAANEKGENLIKKISKDTDTKLLQTIERMEAEVQALVIHYGKKT